MADEKRQRGMTSPLKHTKLELLLRHKGMPPQPDSPLQPDGQDPSCKRGQTRKCRGNGLSGNFPLNAAGERAAARAGSGRSPPRYTAAHACVDRLAAA